MSGITSVKSLAERGIQRVPVQYVRNPGEDIFNNINSSHAQDIVNHGISESLIARVQAVGKAFFELPIEEKELYKREGGGNNAGYGSKVGISADAKLDWRDSYYNIVWPVSQRVMSKWPKQPSDFTEVMDEYSKKICKLWEVLMQALCDGLGLANENALDEALGGERKEIHFTINYYPPCPQPEQVLGISAHSDVDALTILLQDQTPGLQILKGDVWLEVPCIPGALVVNIGDQIEVNTLILSLDIDICKYKFLI
ncbi:hypothetical protein SUGI_0944800 [Cryptomeria japonica]|nr:hypothetical protein SUGI_0944800 [Cryptomeria japonica]